MTVWRMCLHSLVMMHAAASAQPQHTGWLWQAATEALDCITVSITTEPEEVKGLTAYLEIAWAARSHHT